MKGKRVPLNFAHDRVAELSWPLNVLAAQELWVSARVLAEWGFADATLHVSITLHFGSWKKSELMQLCGKLHLPGSLLSYSQNITNIVCNQDAIGSFFAAIRYGQQKMKAMV